MNSLNTTTTNDDDDDDDDDDLYLSSASVHSTSCLWGWAFNTEVFCAVYDYSGKEDLNKGKLGVTTHVSEIFKSP